MNELPESTNNGTDLESLDLDYLRGVKSSTCLLLPTTPSPSPLDFKHPLSEQMNEGTFMELAEEPNMVTIQNSDALAGDSSSSGDSNSVVQDPVSAQLINNISMLDYQTLSKTGDMIIGQNEDSIKLNGNANISNRKLPNFVNWKWNVIRKVLLWIVLSGLIVCLAAIITMVVTIPKECNPDHPWYQGKVFYEVFPASFKDMNNDGVGDLKGLIKNLDYIEDLGVSAIRLNYIYEAEQYPDRYYNTTSLLKIDRSIGTMKDFQELVTEVHKRNISLILDIPVTSMVSLSSPNWNFTIGILVANGFMVNAIDPTSAALAFWARTQNVDGFYMKNLERYVEDGNFGKSLQIWKQIIGNGKILIASEESYLNSKGVARNVLLARIDLIDIHIDVNNGTLIKAKIQEVITGPLWSKPHYPWVHWNIGNINTERVSTKHLNNALALIVLEFILPGTVSIFYGDEIGLGELSPYDIEDDFHEHEHTHNLVPMVWMNGEKNGAIPSWNSKSDLEPTYYFLEVIKGLIKVKLNTPTIYLNSIYKDGNILKNTAVRKTEDALVVIERWYPRRSTCVYIGNFGNETITTDLSTMFYGGAVVAGTNTTVIGEVLYFNNISFTPYSAMIFKLEK